MKKIFILAAVAVMAFGATMAFAQGYGRGMGRGGCANGYFQGNGGGPGAFGIGSADFANVTEDEARTKVQAYIDANLKGYSITGAESFKSPRGFDCYIVKVSDANGNNFVFMVGARGYVRGPILESNWNTWQQPNIPAPAK